MFANEELYEKAKEKFRKVKWIGIVVSILMIIMGIVMFVLPNEAHAVLLWLMVAAMLIDGISNIVIFATTPKGVRRSGLSLAVGIIWVILSICLALTGIMGDVMEKLVLWGTFQMVLGIMIGFNCVFQGVNSLSMCGEIAAAGGSRALAIINGIILLLLGVTCLSSPIGALIGITIVFGIFVLVNGIASLIGILSYKE